jgi:hypothetical protein
MTTPGIDGILGYADSLEDAFDIWYESNDGVDRIPYQQVQITVLDDEDDSVDEYAEIYARERDDEGVSHTIMEYGIITLEDGDITIYQTEVKKN